MPHDIEWREDVPAKSKLSLSARSKSMGFTSEAVLTVSGNQEVPWSHAEILGGQVRVDIESPKTYALKVNLRVLDTEPVELTATLTLPDGAADEIAWTLQGPGEPTPFIRMLLVWTA